MPTVTWVALGLAVVILPFLMRIYYRPPVSQDQEAIRANRFILRVLLSLEAGLVAWFIAGSALFDAKFHGPGEQITISGTFGCALFLVVFISQRKDKSPPAVQDGTVSITTANGSTFEDTARNAVGKQYNVKLIGFSDKQRCARLLAVEMKPMAVRDALLQLHSLVAEVDFPRYTVTQNGPVFEIRTLP